MSCMGFKISKFSEAIIIEKDNQRLSISQADDDDIWFVTSNEELSIDISMYSRIYSEWQTYIVFENLMKSIVGRYMLNGDNDANYLWFPKDFIDLCNKTIIWHSDNGIDNILKLSYSEKIINISLFKSKEVSSYCTNAIRIRTNGSKYGYYYQEFLNFFRCLYDLEQRLNEQIAVLDSKQNEVPVKRKSFY